MKQVPGNTHFIVKHILFTLLMILLVIPGLQGKFGLIAEKKLKGSFTPVEKPDPGRFSWKTWFDGSFQDEFNNRLENNIGFRNTLIRLNNQADYSLFRQTKAEGVIVGTNGELFEEDYIREYLGLYFVGDSVWSRKASNLKAVQDTLAKLGKSLVVIIEPGKGSFYSDKLPRKYRHTPKNRSNYDVLSEQLKREGVNFLDLNQYFIQIKASVKDPVFPKCGTHWSYYGAALAADTTLKYLENLRNADFPDMRIVSNEIPDTIRHPDYDIGLAMNLIYKIPHRLTTNPVIEFKQGVQKTRPNVLLVGDSFYFNWLNNRIPTRAFSVCDFWYYNKNITHSDGSQDGEAGWLNFRDEILKRDIIIIMITERFMHAFAWQFDEQLYDLFYPGNPDPIEYFSNQVRTYGELFTKMYDESLAMNISLVDRINKEATYLLYEDSKKNPEKYTSKRDLMILYEMGIRNTPEWMEEIKRKATVNRISIDEQIRADAEWIYNDKHGKK